MIKNLVISGCSFTDNRASPTWVNSVVDTLRPNTVINLARSGAGNIYISHAVIDCLTRNNFVPAETLVLIMWSGADRQDMLVSGEYWWLLENYVGKTIINDPDGYWIFSGGRSNSWLDHSETRRLFTPYYTTVDPFVMCAQSLHAMLSTSAYLAHHGFQHAFMTHVNYWNSDPSCQSVADGNFNMVFFCQDMPIFQRMSFDHWIFLNHEKDTIYEFCEKNNLLADDRFHPSPLAHKVYAEQIIVPYLERNIL